MQAVRILQTEVPPGVIDLGLGNPDPDLLPLALLQHSADSFFAHRDPGPLQYGYEQGDGYLRLALADFISSSYAVPASPEQFFITSGASAGISLLCTLYTRPGDIIFVEEPTYFLALRIFTDHGLRPVPVPMDSDGLCLDALDEKLTEMVPRFLYTVPTFQNPSGRTLSAERRLALVARARQHGFMIIADEVYHALAYDQTPPRPFAVWSKSVELVVSLGSFSKILAPGLRLGWIQAHSRVLKRLTGSGLLDSGGGMNPMVSALVREVVASGDLERNIAALRAAYTVRLDALDAALRQHLPQAAYERPQGGFFFWVHLPDVDTTSLRDQARALHVDIRPGVLFSSQQGMREYMRLGFCFYTPGALNEGVARLAASLSEWKRGSRGV